MEFQENFKFEKNKLIYYQTLKSNLRFMMLKGQFSMLDIFDVSNRNLQMAVQKISRLVPSFISILSEGGISIQHGAISQLLQKFCTESISFSHMLEQLSKRVTSFRELLIDKITDEINTVTPLASPNPSGTTSFKTNMNGLNPLSAVIIMNHVPKSFFMMMKKIDFSDFEILAIYDCKIIEASMLVWASKDSRLK